MSARRGFAHARSCTKVTAPFVSVATFLGLACASSHLSSRSSSSNRPHRPLSLYRPAFAESTSETDAPSEPPSDTPDHALPRESASSASAQSSQASSESQPSSSSGPSSSDETESPGVLASAHSKLQKYEAYRYMVTVAEDNGLVEPEWGEYGRMQTPKFLQSCGCSAKERAKPCWPQFFEFYDCLYRCNRKGHESKCERCTPAYEVMAACEAKFPEHYKDADSLGSVMEMNENA